MRNRRRLRASMRVGTLAVLVAAASLATTGAASSAGSAEPNIVAYRGLATWVDIYDTKTWARNPRAVIRSMKRKGVRTIFFETGNYRQRVKVVRPAATGRFLDAAHAAGLKVVAWYLPSLKHPNRDYKRAIAAIRFRSAKGQRFDSFSLDIEASVVKNVPRRNRNLLALSNRIRAAAGPDYPLGAIIPSPRGMERLPKYWPSFPYAELAKTYDVFLPMGYFSYRPRDLGGPYGYTMRNVKLIRQRTGDPQIPIHAIGGLSQRSSGAQVRKFVRASRDCGITGASMYDFPTTRRSAWKQLRRVRTAPSPALPVCS